MGVVFGAVAVVGGPLVLLWDDMVERLTKQAMGIYLALMGFLLVAYSGGMGGGVDQVGEVLRGGQCSSVLPSYGLGFAL